MTNEGRPWERDSPTCGIQTEADGWDRENHGDNITVTSWRGIRVVCSLEGQLPSDAAVWSRGFTTGRHVFAIMWPRDQRIYYGADIVVGLGFSVQTQNETGRCLVGGNSLSVGFNLVNNSLWYDGVKVRHYPPGKPRYYSVPTLFYMYADFDDDLLSFGCDEEFWGVALTFKEIRRRSGKDCPLFPMASFRKIQGKFMIFYKGTGRIS